MHCLREKDFKTLSMFFLCLSLSFFNYRCTSKGITQILPRMALWLRTRPMDSPQPSLFLRQPCDATTMSSLFWRHFSNSFCTVWTTLNFFFFYTSTKYLRVQDVSLFGFFLQLHPVVSSSVRVTYYLYLYLYVIVFFFFLIQIRSAGHQ